MLMQVLIQPPQRRKFRILCTVYYIIIYIFNINYLLDLKLNHRSCKMRSFCDSKMDQGFFQVSPFQPTRKSPRHMLPKRGPCLARHTSTSASGSPAAGSPPTRKRPAPGSGPEAMPPRRSPRLVEDLLCNRPASQGNSSPAKSSARVKA